MSKRGLLLVFGLFILGLAFATHLRQRSAERAAVSAVTEAPARPHAETASPALDIRFEDAEGKTVTLAQFSGRYVLLNVWATWCAPCRKEMPSLDRLQRAMSQLPFDVVALSVDKDGVPVVDRFYRDLGLGTLRIYVDTTSAVLAKLGIAGIPTTVMIDPSGRELWRISGPVEWDNPDVIRRLTRDVTRR